MKIDKSLLNSVGSHVGGGGAAGREGGPGR